MCVNSMYYYHPSYVMVRLYVPFLAMFHQSSIHGYLIFDVITQVERRFFYATVWRCYKTFIIYLINVLHLFLKVSNIPRKNKHAVILTNIYIYIYVYIGKVNFLVKSSRILIPNCVNTKIFPNLRLLSNQYFLCCIYIDSGERPHSTIYGICSSNIYI